MVNWHPFGTIFSTPLKVAGDLVYFGGSHVFSFDANFDAVMAMSTDGRLCLLLMASIHGGHVHRQEGGTNGRIRWWLGAVKNRQGSTDAYLGPRRTVCIIYIIYYILFIYIYIIIYIDIYAACIWAIYPNSTSWKSSKVRIDWVDFQ